MFILISLVITLNLYCFYNKINNFSKKKKVVKQKNNKNNNYVYS